MSAAPDPAELDALATCLVLNTVRAARALTRRYDARLAPHGVTVAQFAALGGLRAAPGSTVSELAERSATDRSTLSRNLDLMARRGWVAKRPGARGNALTCDLTPEGEALLDRLVPLWREAQAEMRAHLAGHDADAYLAMLRRMTEI